MSNDKCREEFEKWYQEFWGFPPSRALNCETHKGMTYGNISAENAWKGWQAAYINASQLKDFIKSSENYEHILEEKLLQQSALLYKAREALEFYTIATDYDIHVIDSINHNYEIGKVLNDRGNIARETLKMLKDTI